MFAFWRNRKSPINDPSIPTGYTFSPVKHVSVEFNPTARGGYHHPIKAAKGSRALVRTAMGRGVLLAPRFKIRIFARPWDIQDGEAINVNGHTVILRKVYDGPRFYYEGRLHIDVWNALATESVKPGSVIPPAYE